MSEVIQLGLAGEAEAAPVREGAGFGIRFLARAIDLVVQLFLGAAVGVVAAILVLIGSSLQGFAPDAGLARLGEDTQLGFLAAVVGGLAYHVLAEGLHGSTIGKRVCGLTVVSEDGAPADLAAALKRGVAYFWDALFFGMVAYGRMKQSPERQRYGDAWGRTQVVRISSLPAEHRRSFLRFAGANLAGLVLAGTILFIEVGWRFA